MVSAQDGLGQFLPVLQQLVQDRGAVEVDAQGQELGPDEDELRVAGFEAGTNHGEGFVEGPKGELGRVVCAVAAAGAAHLGARRELVQYAHAFFKGETEALDGAVGSEVDDGCGGGGGGVVKEA